jgi:prephenate dehydratase
MTSRVAYLGPEGTFSFQATQSLVAQKKDLVAVPFQSMYKVLAAVESGETEFALVPIENLVEGTISEPLDFLVHSNELQIVSELVEPIQLDVIGLAGTEFADVKEVISHANPVGQSRNFVRQHMPLSKEILAPSTVAAIEMVSQRNDKTVVAIGNSSMNDRYGVVTLVKNVGDVKNNKTRFVLLQKHALRDSDTSEKISFVLSLPKDQPGGLYKIMGLLQSVNLTKIESRPSKEVLGSYYFFIDFQGNYSDPDIRKMLGAVKDSSDTFKILGAYKEIPSC